MVPFKVYAIGSAIGLLIGHFVGLIFPGWELSTSASIAAFASAEMMRWEMKKGKQ